jgi:hypothetical protein
MKLIEKLVIKRDIKIDRHAGIVFLLQKIKIKIRPIN